ncbi:MAG TPA: CvpA family protein [Azospirillaceae bacterium]|nr:CvpA family protein [Azospirillaceae bacterium]
MEPASASGLNPVDVGVAAVVLLSALLAFARGFVREVLSIAAWVGAAVVTLYAFHSVRPYVQAYIERQLIADGVAIVGLFVASLLVFSVLSHMLSAKVSDSALSAIDRSLGFGFGVVRGAVLVSLAYMFATFIWPDNPPDWLRDARTRPMLASGADMLRGFVPDSAGDRLTREAEDRRAAAERAAADLKALERLSNPAPANTSPAPNAGAREPDRGYNDRERAEMEKALEALGQQKP